MRRSFRLCADPRATLKCNCVSQVMVINSSTLASTAVVLIQVVPAILSRLQ